MFRPCILVPTYNNSNSIGALLGELAVHQKTVVLVDDGSEPATNRLLTDLAAKHTFVELVVRQANGGKGAAVKTGLRRAIDLGFTHALQLDADGQHDPAEIPGFLAEAERHPQVLVLGTPVFSQDVPKSRLYGRQVSRVMVWLETLSLQIKDPLFGFRVYPLAAVSKLLDRCQLGERMDFDPEIAVRLYWQGLSVRNLMAAVRYPEDGVSHFQMFRDNFRLSWLHTRLLLGMLLRAPWLIARHFP